jgi:ribonuclease HI
MDRFATVEDPSETSNCLIAFTDGACTGNGKAHARASYAVVWPEHDEMDGSYLLPSNTKQTNNRAELQAISHALHQADELDPSRSKTLILYTDSMLAINSLTVWIHNWKANGWKKAPSIYSSPSSSTTVLNQDILQAIDAQMQRRKVTFRHVRAHTTSKTYEAHYNNLVDKMAVAALVSNNKRSPKSHAHAARPHMNGAAAAASASASTSRLHSLSS